MDETARLAAIEEIKALKYRYWTACDAKDPDGFRDCFIREGAHVGLGTIGDFDNADDAAQAFRDLGCAQVAGTYAVFDMHHGLHPAIDIRTLDTAGHHGEAVGTWSLRFRQVNTVYRTESIMTGSYSDTYVIEDGQWRISESRFTVWWSMVTPLPDDAVIHPGAALSDTNTPQP